MSTLRDWLKEKWQWLALAFLLFIIITLSFGIGYLVARESNPAPIIIEKSN